MLSLFPQILFLSPFAPTLLRIAAGIMFLVVAWDHCRKRKELSDVPLVIIGSSSWVPVLASTIETLVGMALIAGLYTQGAAICGVLLALKQFTWQRQYPQFFPLPRSTSALLFVICITLVVTGAGVFAFDLPL